MMSATGTSAETIAKALGVSAKEVERLLAE